MKYTDDEWNREPVYFHDGEGLLVPGIEDSYIYDIATNEDRSKNTYIAELDINPPTEQGNCHPKDVEVMLKRYLKDREISKDPKYYCYVRGRTNDIFDNFWYHVFEFKLDGDTILIVRTNGMLELYINKEKIKYTNDTGGAIKLSTLHYLMVDLCIYLDKKYFADLFDFDDYSYTHYMGLLLKLYASKDDKISRERLRPYIIKARESISRKPLLGLFKEVLSNNK